MPRASARPSAASMFIFQFPAIRVRGAGIVFTRRRYRESEIGSHFSASRSNTAAANGPAPWTGTVQPHRLFAREPPTIMRRLRRLPARKRRQWIVRMLDALRRSAQSWVMKALLAVLALTFVVFFGSTDSGGGGGDQDSATRVGDVAVPVRGGGQTGRALGRE